MTARRFFMSTIRVVDSSLPFISTWRTTNTSTGSSASNQVKLPLINGGTYNLVVNWGDGNEDTITVWNQAETTHTYAATGDYTITITGTIIGWTFNSTGDRLKILEISQWGSLSFVNNTDAFRTCTNLVLTAIDAPTLSGSCVGFFESCTNLTGNSSLNTWDVSAVTNMAAFFRLTNFNQPLNNWNVSSVTSFGSDNRGMFSSCPFNQNINSWNVSSATSFQDMFRSNTAFNQTLNSWTTSSATNMIRMFNGSTSFNQNINSWNTSNVTSFVSMFQGATAFNTSIDGWNVTNCTSFNQMFQSSGYNQSLNSWSLRTTGTANISLASMFRQCPFNQPLNNWNTSKVVSMGGNSAGMFSLGSAFNQDISMWDVSGVTSFREMFDGNLVFNQNIGSWNVSAATDIQGMFRSATAFNQNIGSWNVSSVTVFLNFMANKTNLNYSAANLDAIYNGWTNRAIATAITITFGTIKYTAAATSARALLTRANATVTVTNAANNGSGLIRITTGAAHGRTTGDKIFISGVTGTTEANGGWIVTVIDATTVDLQSSTFTNTYVSGGTFRIGYGWTITDGGL